MSKKRIYIVAIFAILLTAMFGIETQLVAQERQRLGGGGPSFENPVITTDCCPWHRQILDSVMNNTPFVFEGRMIKSEFYGRLDDSYLFEIEKVYRGGERLQAGTVEIVDRLVAFMPRLNFYRGWYIIFAKEIETQGAFDANNSVKLELFYIDDTESASYWGEERDDTYKGLYSRFRTKEEVRNLLATYGLTPTDVPKADTLKILSYREIKEAKEKDIRDAEAKLRGDEENK